MLAAIREATREAAFWGDSNMRRQVPHLRNPFAAQWPVMPRAPLSGPSSAHEKILQKLRENEKGIPISDDGLTVVGFDAKGIRMGPGGAVFTGSIWRRSAQADTYAQHGEVHLIVDDNRAVVDVISVHGLHEAQTVRNLATALTPMLHDLGIKHPAFTSSPGGVEIAHYLGSAVHWCPDFDTENRANAIRALKGIGADLRRTGSLTHEVRLGLVRLEKTFNNPDSSRWDAPSRLAETPVGRMLVGAMTGSNGYWELPGHITALHDRGWYFWSIPPVTIPGVATR